jgi:fumarate hydratase subunit alpha
MIKHATVIETVAECLIEASTTFRTDQIAAYEKAIKREDNPNARWVLERIIENARFAQKNRKPLCNDTGIPHVFIEVGEDVGLEAGFFNAIHEGVRLGLVRLPGRPMAVKGNPLERLGQIKGLYKDSGMLVSAPLQIRIIPSKKIMVTVMMLGGGPDIRAKTYRVFHRHKGENVLKEVSEWATSEVQKLGCTPTVPALGIGRTSYEATCLMLEAMKDGDLLHQSKIEKEFTNQINQTNVGPLGLKGKSTALGSFIKVGPFRAGGTRMASLRLCCCMEPRCATRQLYP